VAGRRNLRREIALRYDVAIAVLLDDAALVIVIVEIGRSAHNGFQFIQPIVAGNLKPRRFADWLLGGGGLMLRSVPDQSEVYSVHLYLHCYRGPRRCGFCG
jgi:hypothetical protein